MSLGSSGRVPTKRMRPIGLPAQRLAGDDAVAAVGFAAGALEQVVEVVEAHRARLPPGRRELCALGDGQLLASHVGDVVFRDVVAERPHQLGHDHFGAGGHRAVAGRIELEEPALPGGVLDGESGRHAVALRRGDRPGARRRAAARVRSPGHVLGRQRVMAGAVGEPARVRHFVDGVDVLRPRRRAPCRAWSRGWWPCPPSGRARAASCPRHPRCRARPGWDRR